MFNHKFLIGRKKIYIINGMQSYRQFDSDSEETTCCCFPIYKKPKPPGIEDHGVIANLQQKCESLEGELQTCKNELTKCQREKEDLISRLSELMGKQLQENNPHITNLNDPDRPQKLAERLNEIYGNEWTDALSNLQTVVEKEEADRIKILFDLLKITYDGCLNHVHKRLDQVRDWFKDHKKCENSRILDFVVSIASSMISVIETDINKVVVAKYGDNVATVCTDYLQRCVGMCFNMAVKSPEVYLQFDCSSQVDKSSFKPYTKDGEQLDYLVWPALFLYHGGPLMAKGVVQCQEKVPDSLSDQC